jgi:hypothetical protein
MMILMLYVRIKLELMILSLLLKSVFTNILKEVTWT